MAGAKGAAATAEIDAYLDGLPAEQKTALSHLRSVLKQAAPEAEEVITYAMPGIGMGSPLVSYRAFAKHLSFFPMGDSVFVGMADEIAPWRTSKGTLQFAPDAPLPDALVQKMVAARIGEVRAKAAKTTRKKG